MKDLIYFGYEWEEDSPVLEKEFIESITKLFPHVKLKNAYDSIKGYRQEVELPDVNKDDYFSWILADGWAYSSFNMQIMMMDKAERAEFDRLFALAKKQYPQNFKPVKMN